MNMNPTLREVWADPKFQKQSRFVKVCQTFGWILLRFAAAQSKFWIGFANAVFWFGNGEQRRMMEAAMKLAEVLRQSGLDVAVQKMSQDDFDKFIGSMKQKKTDTLLS